MKKVIMFEQRSCPYCRRAHEWMDELFARRPELRPEEIAYIDEGKYPDLADKYDYYYVPTFYVDDVKVHEGAASAEIIEKVFTLAAEK